MSAIESSVLSEQLSAAGISERVPASLCAGCVDRFSHVDNAILDVGLLVPTCQSTTWANQSLSLTNVVMLAVK